MDRISAGIDWLNTKLRTDASQEVQYQRNDNKFTMQAVLGVGRTSVRDDGNAHLRVEYSDADFILPVKDFLESDLKAPQAGDIIERSTGSNTYQYEVGNMGADGSWRYSDAYQTNFRVHTKLVRVL